MFRNKHLFRKSIRYTLWKPRWYLKRFKKSWGINLKIAPLDRYSILWGWKYYNRHHQFYKSQNKLQCFLHYNFSVPSRRLHLSRFMLTKASDRLILGGFQKN